MTRPKHSNTNLGWVRKELSELRRMIRESNAAKRLQAATISVGGITIKDGGSLRTKYGNNADGVLVGPWDDAINSGITVFMKDQDWDSTDPFDLTDLGTFAAEHVLLESVGFDQWRFVFRGGVKPGADEGIFSVADCYVQIVGTRLLLGTNGVSNLYIENGQGLWLGHDDGVRIQHGTVATAANCHINSVSGVISRSTSSRRYKRDIEDLDVDVDAVLTLRPRLCRLKTEVDEFGDDAPVYAVFIAEEAHDLGLEQWVTCDDEGPEAFDYGGFGAVAHQAVLQAHQKRITELEARVSALENGG